MKRGVDTVKKKRQDPYQILGEGMNMPLRNVGYH